MFEAAAGWLLFAACALAPPLAFLFSLDYRLRLCFALLVVALTLFFYPLWLLLLAGPIGIFYVAGLVLFAPGAPAVRRAAGVSLSAALLAGWLALLWPGGEFFAPLLPGDAPRDVESASGALQELAAHPISGPLALAALALMVATALAALYRRRSGGASS